MRSIGDPHMSAKLQLRSDSLLLLSLLLVILLNPVLDHCDCRRLVLAALLFISVILSTVRLSQIRVRMWPVVLLMLRRCCLHDSERYLRQSGATWIPLGICGCVLRTHCCETFLRSSEFPFRQSGGSLHCRQYLSFAWGHLGRALGCDGGSSPGFIPVGNQLNRPPE
jgi:hypothetical protein